MNVSISNIMSQIPTFRHLLPSKKNPHPRLNLDTINDEDAYTWAEKAKKAPVVQDMINQWNSLHSQPYYGITTDGSRVDNIYILNADKGCQNYSFTIKEMVSAAQMLLTVANDTERDTFNKSLDDDSWRLWSNPELYINKIGIRLEESRADIQVAILRLLEASLSKKGYEKIVACMRMNEFLGVLVHAEKIMNFYSYNFNLFGTPSLESPWGFHIYGHHMCINILAIKNQLVISPVFMGAEPDIIDEGPQKGLRIFDSHEKCGLALMNSLKPVLQKKAQIFENMHGEYLPATRYNRFDERHLGGAFQDNRIIPFEGLNLSILTTSQRQLLMETVKCFINFLPLPALEDKLQQIDKYINQTWLTWYGGFGHDDTFYYRIQSPVILVEFDHHKGVWLTNTTPAKCHIHTVVRTPNGNDYGKELVRRYFNS